MKRKRELIEELKKINFYWKELGEKSSDEELEEIIKELKEVRKTLKSIFNFKIMGEV